MTSNTDKGRRCPACDMAVDADLTACPHCGTLLEASESATTTAPRPAQSSSRPTASPSSSPSGGAGGNRQGERFALGAIIGGRYRVLGLAGRGGMGEVFRAEDIKLDQQVALKFLPRGLERDRARLERLFSEVRTARQVSHPAVCRVWDIGEADGQHFLTMEYVDGENLSSLLRRIGRLPHDKALEIAEQVCAGLAAAHEKKVIHRDLKPANIMLDSEGKVRITDFGLAGLAHSFEGADVRSGTPAFMAPEQLQGREVTTLSDIYALGLVLYEVFTGKRAFEGRTHAELTRKQTEEHPIDPSLLVSDMPPAVERAILACLQKSPRRRPPSALAVAAMLRGQDPLEAAIAAGTTPSPELVAAAGESEAPSSRLAWACTAVSVLGALLSVPLLAPSHIVNLTPPEMPPAVLEHRAREVLKALGHTAPQSDAAHDLFYRDDYFQAARGSATGPRDWGTARDGYPPVVQFWYRQSPRPLVSLLSSGRVYWDMPPLDVSGDAAVSLDLQGHLTGFYSVPAETEPPANSPPEPRWTLIFKAAGLEENAFSRVKPEWTPPFFADTRAAWTGHWPGRSDIPIRLEVAGYRGRIVWLRIIEPWTRPARMQTEPRSLAQEISAYVASALLVALLGMGSVLARRNLRLGRVDRRGATRIAAITLGVGMARGLLTMHHVASLFGEIGLLFRVTGPILVQAMLLWVFYLALEPFLRRHRPRVLVSWTRLVAGGYRDAVVARDVLIGCAWAGATAILFGVGSCAPEWMGSPAPPPNGDGLVTLLGLRSQLASLAGIAASGIIVGLGALLLLLVLRLALRHNVPTIIVAALALTTLWDWSAEPLWLWVVLRLVIFVSYLLLLLRFGLVAGIVGMTVVNLLANVPQTLNLSAWYAQPVWTAVLATIALAVLALRSALRGTTGHLPTLTGNTTARG